LTSATTRAPPLSTSRRLATPAGTATFDERAVVDGELITAGPQSPVQFARAALGRLGLASERTLEAYEGVFHRADPAAFPVLMEVQGAR
jgi:hypothetical protein